MKCAANSGLISPAVLVIVAPPLIWIVHAECCSQWARRKAYHRVMLWKKGNVYIDPRQSECLFLRFSISSLCLLNIRECKYHGWMTSRLKPITACSLVGKFKSMRQVLIYEVTEQARCQIVELVSFVPCQSLNMGVPRECD